MHVKIRAAKYNNTEDAVDHFTPSMALVQFTVPYAGPLVEHHVISILQHYYLYHHVMTEVQEVDASITLVTCHTPTHQPVLKEGVIRIM